MFQNCSFLALDCELSGLGERRKLNAPAVDERYENIFLIIVCVCDEL